MTRRNSPLVYRLDSSDQFAMQRVCWFGDDPSVTVLAPAGAYTDEYESQARAALKARHKSLKGAGGVGMSTPQGSYRRAWVGIEVGKYCLVAMCCVHLAVWRV